MMQILWEISGRSTFRPLTQTAPDEESEAE